MIEVYRIIDRFTITDKGFVYSFETKAVQSLKLNDIVYDLQGNEFQVSGVEMIRRAPNQADNGSVNQQGFFIQSKSGKQAMGSILLKKKPTIHFLFSSDPLNFRKVDSDYLEEYTYASKNYDCALFSLERFEEGKSFIFGDSIQGITIYRGWMLSVDEYRRLYVELLSKGIYLINTPEEYERYHHLPNWYQSFEGETFESFWSTSDKLEDIEKKVGDKQGAFIVKDYVKSRKHEWYDACYIDNIANQVNFREIVTNFVKRQGSQFVGGIVLRKYEKLNYIGFHDKSGMPIAEEYRIFVYAGEILIIGDYWNGNTDGYLSSSETAWIRSIVQKVNSNFVTIDVARKEDGSLILMEFGDGQVSGLQELGEKEFYAAFAPLLSI
ncbi:ATP-grasp domain-containing protein [Streptococcus cuniculi]|nr:ATP-grasp domain-containing protein [Streptococcus cuniculi]